jgi:hypothetical protein
MSVDAKHSGSNAQPSDATKEIIYKGRLNMNIMEKEIQRASSGSK